MRRPPVRTRSTIGPALVAGVVLFVVGVFLFGGDRPLARLVGGIAGCSTTVVHTQDPGPDVGGSWLREQGTTLVRCDRPRGGSGPVVSRVRFRTAADLKHDLLADPSSLPTCIAGRTVYVGSFDGVGQFRELCAKVDGDLVDAVGEGPGAGGSTPRAQPRPRDAALQGQALRRYFADQGNVRSPR